MSTPPPAPPRRKRFGLISLLLATAAFALVAVSLAIFLAIPNDASDAILDAATWFLVVSFLLVAPLMELVGIVLGFIALLRSGDSKLLGILGAALNIALLAGGVILGTLLIAHVGSPR